MQGGSRQDRVFLAVNSAAVSYLVCMNAGRTVRVEVARGLEIAVDVEGGGFRARDLPCEADAEAFFCADKLSMRFAYMPPMAARSRAYVGVFSVPFMGVIVPSA